jgi:hypothetical protein
MLTYCGNYRVSVVVGKIEISNTRLPAIILAGERRNASFIDLPFNHQAAV